MQGMPIILFLQMREESPFALRACMGWVLQLIYCRVVHSQFKQSHKQLFGGFLWGGFLG